MTNKVEEAMKDYWGERCPEFEGMCVKCQAWKEYDDLSKKKVVEFRNLAFHWFRDELGWKSFIDNVNKKLGVELSY